MIAGDSPAALFVRQRLYEACDFRPELGHAPFHEAPDRCVVDSAIRVSQLVSEGDDRAASVMLAASSGWSCRATRSASPTISN